VKRWEALFQTSLGRIPFLVKRSFGIRAIKNNENIQFISQTLRPKKDKAYAFCIPVI
jgi:hypothetical protein